MRRRKRTDTRAFATGSARRLAVGALALAIAVAGFLAIAGEAGAHARYDRSEPDDGEVLSESPERVDAWFTQELARTGGLPAMIVVNDSGDVISQGDAVLNDDDRTHMWVEIPPAMPDGRYTVIWHNVSDADGDEAQGAFHFFVGEGAPGAASPGEETPEVTPPPEDEATPAPTPPGDDPTPTPEPEVQPLTDDDDGGGVPVWVLVLGVFAGVVAGGGAGLALGSRRGG